MSLSTAEELRWALEAVGSGESKTRKDAPSDGAMAWYMWAQDSFDDFMKTAAARLIKLGGGEDEEKVKIAASQLRMDELIGRLSDTAAPVLDAADRVGSYNMGSQSGLSEEDSY